MTGKAAPRFEDTETTIAELQVRIANTLTFLNSIGPNDFDAVTDTTVVKMTFPAGKAMLAPDAMFSRWMPNFFFHVSMTYAILRGSGIALGKMDYLGKIAIFDAPA